MIVLDTNIISEPNKRLPAQQVVDWLNSQQAPALFTTTINVAELRFGIERLPGGKKKLRIGPHWISRWVGFAPIVFCPLICLRLKNLRELTRNARR